MLTFSGRTSAMHTTANMAARTLLPNKSHFSFFPIGSHRKRIQNTARNMLANTADSIHGKSQSKSLGMMN